MFTILIPVLKNGFLESQLYWLSKQTYKEFNVIAMDAFYRNNRYQPWAHKKYPFSFEHVPLVHHISMPKRCDFSIKNNLAFLSPTNHFLFLSDTHYMLPNFAEKVAGSLMRDPEGCPVFDAYTILYSAYDAYRKVVDLGGETTHEAKPVAVFSRKQFFYVLNGFDEAMSYCYAGNENITQRLSMTGIRPDAHRGLLFHILHNPVDNNFGKFWQKPCEKCEALFPRWRFEMAEDSGEFPMTPDPELYDQMTYMDNRLGVPMFMCPNCGFGGCYDPAGYNDLILTERLVDAPTGALEGRTGRNLGKLYETMTKKVDNNLSAKIAYLKTTY